MKTLILVAPHEPFDQVSNETPDNNAVFLFRETVDALSGFLVRLPTGKSSGSAFSFKQAGMKVEGRRVILEEAPA